MEIWRATEKFLVRPKREQPQAMKWTYYFHAYHKVQQIWQIISHISLTFQKEEKKKGETKRKTNQTLKI